MSRWLQNGLPPLHLLGTEGRRRLEAQKEDLSMPAFTSRLLPSLLIYPPDPFGVGGVAQMFERKK